MPDNFWGSETGNRSKALQFMQAYANPRAGDVFWKVGQDNIRPKDVDSAEKAIAMVSSGDDLLRKMLEQMFLKESFKSATGTESQYKDIADSDYQSREPLFKRWMRRAGI